MTTEAQNLFNDLKEAGYSLMIGKTEYAKITKCSVSTVSNNISKGRNICKYQKMGNKHNSQVLFNLRDVAVYLTSHTVKVA